MLHRGKVIYVIIIRHNDHTAWMLSRCSLDAGATNGKPVDFCWTASNAPFVQVFFHITICGFICHSGNRSGFKHIISPEQFFCVTMGRGLIFTREIQVNIRCFITIEAQKCFKWNIMPISVHLCSALRAFLRWQIKPRTNAAICNKFTVLAFWADIMRCKRIDF